MPAVASCAVAASGTEPRRSAAAAGASSVTLFGAVASIFTVAVLSADVTPARFVARYVIVCVPSFEPFAGAGTTTDVPAVNEPPSTLYSRPLGRATPDSASTPVRATVTAALCQFASASSPTVGAVLSTRIVRVAVVVELPTLSGTTARSSYVPSAGVQVAGEAIGLHEPPPSVDCSIAIAAVSTPEPRSLAVTESGIVPWPHWPGSSSVAVGAVLSRIDGLRQRRRVARAVGDHGAERGRAVAGGVPGRVVRARAETVASEVASARNSTVSTRLVASVAVACSATEPRT